MSEEGEWEKDSAKQLLPIIALKLDEGEEYLLTLCLSQSIPSHPYPRPYP